MLAVLVWMLMLSFILLCSCVTNHPLVVMILQNRDGFVMGEGAGVLLLEELEHAKVLLIWCYNLRIKQVILCVRIYFHPSVPFNNIRTLDSSLLSCVRLVLQTCHCHFLLFIFSQSLFDVHIITKLNASITFGNIFK